METIQKGQDMTPEILEEQGTGAPRAEKGAWTFASCLSGLVAGATVGLVGATLLNRSAGDEVTLLVTIMGGVIGLLLPASSTGDPRIPEERRSALF